jgi:hypothetical protein
MLLKNLPEILRILGPDATLRWHSHKFGEFQDV